MPLRKTGVFFHYQEAERMRDFPQALEGILDKPNIFFYDAFYPGKGKALYDLERVPPELLLAVHSPRMLAQVQRSPLYLSALFSAGGTVQAATEVWRGEIDNAFVFTGCGDHHAGRDSFGGGCYLNGAAMAIVRLRGRGASRFAIIDTDAHHGDGTWSLFADDSSVLYLCLCTGHFAEVNNNVNITIPFRLSDEEYLTKVRSEFGSRVRALRPEIIFWNWGYDGTRGDYGDLGLSLDFHAALAGLLQEMADEVCHGRLIAVLCGGRSRSVATYTIPRIIRRLAGLDVS